ncbi:MAG: AAA family ATPase [Pseudobutyrivibrio sp.]|nr:AAA family ATPase [Pseudobutyrivibrio sp.]
MLIRRIKLNNFRQYIDTTIDFSVDPEKNVTIVMGDNGTGKTTLAQAFQWALYGQTEFKIRELINRKVREQMLVGQEKSVSVILDVFYNNVAYTITRLVTYKKQLGGKTEQFGQGKFTISSLNENGVTEYMPDHEKFYFIKRLLPQDLSQFFFFDGEKIEEMAENIQIGKGEDFREAVYSLVGLSATQSAIEHLKSKSSSKNSVIKSLQNELEKNSQSVEKLSILNTQIKEFDEKIENAESRKEELNEDLDKIKIELEKLQHIIFSETPKILVKEEYQKLVNEVSQLQNKRVQHISSELLKNFQRGFYGFVTTCIMRDEKIKHLLEKSAPQDKVIPGLTTKTLDYLVERGVCLCGTSLQEGTLAYKSIEELFQFAYPKTIGALKEDYLKTSRSVEKEGEDFYSTMIKKMKDLSEIDASIEGKETERDEKMNQLANTSRGESAKKQKSALESMQKSKTEELIEVESNLKLWRTSKERKENDKKGLIIIDNDTMKLQRYLNYATAIYEQMRKEYSGEENKYRAKLEEGMNRIFESIYDGNIKIEIDERYRINVTVDEEYGSDDAVERNTAQSYALIFAFITAVIDLAKQKVNDDAFSQDEIIDIEKEGYPLVMDAPLSAFDIKRIQSICMEIPKIADQVIMFIKDTDGNIAEEYMKNRIGARYTAFKVNESNLESDVVKEV